MANDKAFKVKNDLDVGGNVNVAGNLVVEGSTISLDNATVQTFTWGDNDKAIFGDGSDLQIYHDGTISKIDGDVSFTNNVTLSGGTANGVAYLNGSKVLTSGSALTFDGTNFGVNGANTYQKVLTSFPSTYVTTLNIGGQASITNDGGADEVRFTGAANPSGFFDWYLSGSEKMRLTSTGLGIGTSSPASKLDVAGTITADGLTVDGNANITGNTTLGDASTDTVTVNGYGAVGTPNNAIMWRLTGSGGFGGTTQIGFGAAPTGTSAGTAALIGYSSGLTTATASYTIANVYNFNAGDVTKGAGSTITNQHGLYITDQTQGTNNYGITSLVSSGSNKWNIYASGTAANYFAGNVGIGTTSTTNKLNIAGGNAHIGSGYNFTADAGGGYWAGGSGSYATGWYESSGAVLFRTSTTTRFTLGTTEAVFNDPGNDYDFRVESDTNTHALFVDAGNSRVGVNNSTPLVALDVVGDGSFARSVSGGTMSLALKNSGSSAQANYCELYLQSTGDSGRFAIIGVTNGGASQNRNDIYFATNPTAGGPSVVTTITHDKYLRMASGTGGIQFNGDTAAANALDDYEEGTFTPTIVGTTTAGTGTYSVQAGNYTKIGNVVYFNIRLTWSAHTGTGDIRVAGLPYTTSATSDKRVGAIFVTAQNLALADATYKLFGYTSASVNYFTLGQGAFTAGWTGVTIDTAATLFATGFYEV